MEIKVGHFTFEELKDVEHWIGFCNFGSLLSSDVKSYGKWEEVPRLLSEGVTYQLGFDQSTSNTGLFIKNYENTEVFMIEMCRRPKESTASDYIFDLEMFLHDQCQDRLISHLIYERPIKTESYVSSRVLFQLEGMLTMLSRRYSEFRNARMECIENSSWRSVVILPELQKSQDRKLASESSILTLFPWTYNYCGSLGSDRDIFEAMGVMFGWFYNSFDELGRPYVRGDAFNGTIGGFILPDFSSEEISQKFEEAGIKSFWRVENPRRSIFQNLAGAVEKYKVVCVEFKSKSAMLALTVECGIKWFNPEIMTVVLVAANYVDQRLFDICGKEYHFVI